jgi:ABC-2 type transport system ATP-binding protein
MMIAKTSEAAATSQVDADQVSVYVKELYKSYDEHRALDGVSFEVRQGEVFGLLGPNGAGKTSIVEIIEGLRQADGGRVSVCGFDPATDPDAVKERIGVGLQSTALPDLIRVREALWLIGSFYRRQANSDDLLALVSLEEKADSYFQSLSGGQKQRLALALALVNDPDVIILDEPTAGLDPQSRRELHAIIENLRREAKTIILTTHYIEEAEKLCDRVAIVDYGRVIAEGSPRQLISGSQGQSRIEFRTASPVEVAQLRRVPFVSSITHDHDSYVLRVGDAPRAIIELVRWLESEGAEILDLHITRPTLEDVFIDLTGRRIRE